MADGGLIPLCDLLVGLCHLARLCLSTAGPHRLRRWGDDSRVRLRRWGDGSFGFLIRIGCASIRLCFPLGWRRWGILALALSQEKDAASAQAASFFSFV